MEGDGVLACWDVVRRAGRDTPCEDAIGICNLRVRGEDYIRVFVLLGG